MEEAKELAKLLRALANENRLLILCSLMDGPMTAGKLAQFVPGITQSALSQHLKLLKAHGILNCTKSGKNITYFIADPRTGEIIETLKKYYCDGGEID